MSSYEIGYGRPPVATRFAKGRSGNPSGRKKGKLNVVTIFNHVTQATISVTENGRTRTITKLQAMMMQLMNKAVGGDIRAMKMVLEWSHVFSQMTDENPGNGPDAEKKNAVMKHFIEQIRAAALESEAVAADLEDDANAG